MFNYQIPQTILSVYMKVQKNPMLQPYFKFLRYTNFVEMKCPIVYIAIIISFGVKIII